MSQNLILESDLLLPTIFLALRWLTSFAVVFIKFLCIFLRIYMGSSIQYVLKIFRKTNISYPLIRTRSWAYQGVRNVSFSENFAYLLNDLHLDLALLNHIFVYFLNSSHKNINLIRVKSAVKATAYWAQ